MAEFKQTFEAGTTGSSVAVNSANSGNTAVSAVGTTTITATVGEVISDTKSGKCAGAAGTANYVNMPISTMSTAQIHAYVEIRFMDSAYDSGEQFFLIRNSTTSPANKYLTLSIATSQSFTVIGLGGTLYTSPSPLSFPGIYIFDVLTDAGTTTTDGKVRFRCRNYSTGALAGGMTDWVELTGRNMGSGLLTSAFQVGKLTTLGSAAKTIVVDNMYIGDGYTPGGPVGNTAPTVTNSSSAVTVTGTTASISATAADNVGVTAGSWALVDTTQPGTAPSVTTSHSVAPSSTTTSTLGTGAVTGLLAGYSSRFAYTAADGAGLTTTGTPVTVYSATSTPGPITLVNNAGSWVPGGTATDVRTAMNKSVNDDSGWWESPGTPTSASFTVAIGPILAGDESVKVRCRYVSTSGGTFTGTMLLFSAGTLIKTQSPSITMTNAFADYTMTLSSAENASITDRNNLTIQFVGTQS